MNNFFNMISKFNDFRQQIQQTGKDPAKILEELIQSGRVTRDQVERAKQMANTIKSIMGGQRHE